MTKAELIKAYKDGKLKDIGVCTLTNTSAAVIVDINHDEDKVFGYLSGGTEPIFFLVGYKYSHKNEDSTFKVGKMTLSLGQFMRV